jgi:hypothetical protein
MSAPTLATELDRRFLREVAEVLDLQLPFRVLVDGERVDHAHRVALPQLLQLGDDLAVELRVVEPEDYELNRSDCHALSFLPSLITAAPSPRGAVPPA